MQKLLDDIYKIYLRDRRESSAKWERGESFNVFNILGLRTDEVRTHSAFLAELLDPCGSHGMKDRFLKLFLSGNEVFDDFSFNTKSAKVFVEESAGLINEKKTEGGRIDIIIRHGRKAIIIENKIYAGDQEKQLIRYGNYAKMFEDFRLVYLTLDGHEATWFSSGDMTNGKDYFSMSYEHEIVDWLERCIVVAKDRNLVANTIRQYSNLLKELTNQMSNEINEQEIMDILCSKENKVKTAIILDRYNEVRDALNKQMYHKLKEWARRHNLEYQEDNYKDLWFQIYPKGWKSHSLALQYWRSNYYIGIYYTGREHKKVKLSMLYDGVNKDWPFGWKCCTDVFSSMTKLANGEALDFLKKSILSILKEIEDRKDEIEEKNIVM